MSINFDYIVQHLGIQAGGQIDVKKLADGRVELRAAKPAGKISDAFGMLKQPDGKVLSIQEINEVIAASWAGAKS